MPDNPNARLHAVRCALQECGPEASAELVSTFAAQRFGLDIPPAVVALIRATLNDRERLDAHRASRTSGEP